MEYPCYVQSEMERCAFQSAPHVYFCSNQVASGSISLAVHTQPHATEVPTNLVIYSVAPRKKSMDSV